MIICRHKSVSPASRVVPTSTNKRVWNKPSRSHGLTLVEMLVGMAITLVMMAAVVNLFANISEGVRNRRATMEVSATLRIARAQLYKDLAAATCLKYPKDAFGVMPKPDVNNPPDGYFEYVEGTWSDENPSALVLDGNLNTPSGLDTEVSLVPRANDGQLIQWDDANNDGKYDTGETILSHTSALGDYDDILAMTVESPTERFRGKGRGLRAGGIPTNPNDWVDMAIQSPHAEVVWFSIENPPDRSQGEPGMRKLYRRTLLIAPWYGTETRNYGGGPVTGSDPLLDLNAIPSITTFEQQLAALRAFQMEYDISVRLENGRIVPNTLADLARREHRYEHMPNGPLTTSPFFYPYVFVSRGSGYSGPTVRVVRHHLDAPDNNAQINAAANPINLPNQVGDITQYNVVNGGRYRIMPTLIVEGITNTPGVAKIMATARPIMREIPNSDGVWEIAEVSFGPVPLAFNRLGEDLLLDDVLAFDAKVFDPGAPLFNYQQTVINPSSSNAFLAAVDELVGNPTGLTQITGFGAYVDLGWNNGSVADPPYTPTGTAPLTLFQQERKVGWHPRHPADDRFFRGVPATYDTWTTYYETDGIDQNNLDGDGDIFTGADQGTNGLDDQAFYDHDNNPLTVPVLMTINGPDDPMESETSPPYPYVLKGVQVKMRVYEPESRQIRETSVTRNLAK
jgi:type II secretory pathway pseudopilin PulG